MAKIAVILIVCLFAVFSEARHASHGLDRELYLFRRFMQKRGSDLTSCLDEINRLRKQHGAGELAFDKYLNRDALKWAKEEAKSGHVSKDPTAETGGSEEGELSAVINGGGSPAEKCIKAVNKWYSQKDAYKSGGGCGSVNGVASARDFSQLVWKSADTVGLAVVGNFVEARFFPEGNLEGDFDLDVEC